MKYRHLTFLGEKFAQEEDEFFSWEILFRNYEFNRFLEIGTWKGGFALYLKILCDSRGADFYTFDIKPYEDSNTKKKFKFEKTFYQWDVFEKSEVIKNIIKKEGRTILFCDGGDKREEIRVFSSALKPSDIIVVHDWGAEIDKKDINYKKFKRILGRNRLQFFQKI